MTEKKKLESTLNGRMARTCSVILVAILVAACGLLPDRKNPVDAKPATVKNDMGEVVRTRPNQCVPEGQSCAATNAVCCTGYTCVGVRNSVCILSY